MTPTQIDLSKIEWGNEGSIRRKPGGLGDVVTAVLLLIILGAAPLVLASARLWYELPLLLLVAVLMIVQGVRMVLSRESMERRIDLIDIAVGLFTVYATARWLTSPTEYFSRLEVINILAYATLFLTCRYGLVRRTHRLWLVGLLVALGLGEAVFGYLLGQHSDVNHPENLWFPFGDAERLHLHYAPRWLGTYGCPDHFGCLLVMAIGGALALGSFSKLPWPVRIILFYVAGLMAVAVIYSGSRGSWLGLLASITLMTIFGLRHGAIRWWLPLSGAGVLLAVMAALLMTSPMAQTRFWSLVDLAQGKSIYTEVRFELARDALKIANDYPVWGTGPATFVFVHPRYQDEKLTNKAIMTHDDYLNCLADYGGVGLGIALAFVLLVSFRYATASMVDGRWQDRVLVATGISAWAALLIHSFVDFNLHIPANALIFFSLAGVALGRLKGRRPWVVQLGQLGRWPGVALIVLGFLYGAQLARTAMSDVIYEHAQAEALQAPTADSLEEVKEALRYDSGNAQALTMLGDLYRYRASRDEEMADRMTEGQMALEAYRQAQQASQLDDTIQAKMGLTFDLMKRYPEAFFCYQAATQAQPYNGQFWNSLGDHFWQRGMLKKAEEAYLIASKCPHGYEGTADAASELRKMLEAQGGQSPAPETNPAESAAAQTSEPSAEPATDSTAEPAAGAAPDSAPMDSGTEQIPITFPDENAPAHPATTP